METGNSGHIENTVNLERFDEGNEDDFVGQMPEESQQALKDRMLTGISSRIREIEKRKSKRRTYFRIAASVALILAFASSFWILAKPDEVSFQTASNETMEVNLPDGSKVILNSNSKLSYAKSEIWGFDRKVTLAGEGYFEIAKDKKEKRFTINEGTLMEVEVLGTEFNFKNQHPVHKVTLIEGSVALGYQGKSGSAKHSMVPGEMVRLDPGKHELHSKIITNPERLLAWKDRKLKLKNESLEEVLAIVKEVYDLRLESESLDQKDQLVSGSIPLTDSADEVIENIAILFNTKLDVEENLIRVL
ncbi:FecR domain-containing protein [Algoriphagus halophytocola]|uniref:FecR domain-containing protein n=1 Tax=Algoriphagus halophytocola TaxID=2991499 RepID=A0ABY6MK96_9BACT|nr:MULTISPECIES: FecR domain-containing protein [unclassified Algoriphagus]UZD24203.1 FecR domain-containing protein [Algoriphagus sp. TR-M5]WBL41572.1 FecR domain-containing protein [Algoriphagus sp. TR-M9]